MINLSFNFSIDVRCIDASIIQETAVCSVLTNFTHAAGSVINNAGNQIIFSMNEGLANLVTTAKVDNGTIRYTYVFYYLNATTDTVTIKAIKSGQV